MRPPKIDPRCTHEAARKLVAYYARAYAYASATSAFFDELAALSNGQRQAIWNGDQAGRDEPLTGRASPRWWFGRYDSGSSAFVSDVFRSVVARFERGFATAEGRRQVTLACFGDDHDRCADGLLANAAIYATIRVCPRLLRRSTRSAAPVVLHEMMHHDLGLRDVRDPACRRGDEDRCYRSGALQLREHATPKARHNIDNYAYFARNVFESLRAGEQGQAPPPVTGARR